MLDNSINVLPKNLPEPEDDGACKHLLAKKIPNCVLLATNNDVVDISKLKGWVVVYCYPMTGHPNKALPNRWDSIPGARGCTPQACSFRDHYQELKALDVQVYGLSTQNNAYQQEVVDRLHLPFLLLSDSSLSFTYALNLPTFEIENQHLIKRLTLIILDGIIQHVFYPVFPPDKNVDDVIAWLNQNV